MGTTASGCGGLGRRDVMHFFLESFQCLADSFPYLRNLPAPKIMSTMAKIMISSDMPIVPNMV